MNGRKQPPIQALFFARFSREDANSRLYKNFNFCGFSLWVSPMTANLYQTVALCKINCCLD